MIVAALSTLSSVMRTRHANEEKQLARSLGEMLMAEILSKYYSDPDETGTSIGTDSGETAPGDRSLFDDVDDYNDWSATPPQWPDGIDILSRNDWQRSVEVVYIRPVDFDAVLPDGLDFGLKRITIRVARNGNELAELVAIRGKTRDQ